MCVYIHTRMYIIYMTLKIFENKREKIWEKDNILWNHLSKSWINLSKMYVQCSSIAICVHNILVICAMMKNVMYVTFFFVLCIHQSIFTFCKHFHICGFTRLTQHSLIFNFTQFNSLFPFLFLALPRMLYKYIYGYTYMRTYMSIDKQTSTKPKWFIYVILFIVTDRRYETYVEIMNGMFTTFNKIAMT